MRARLLALALLLLAAPAGAVNRYVTPLSTGATYANSTTNAMTLTTANANAQPGDVFLMFAGTYSTSINPAVSGTSGSRITYRAHSLDSTITVTDIPWANRDHITVRKVTSTNLNIGNSLTSEYNESDSLVNVTVPASQLDINLHNLSGVVIYGCNLGDAATTGAADFIETEDWVNVTFRRNWVRLRASASSGSNRIWSPNNQGGAGGGSWTGCVVDSNRFDVTHNGGNNSGILAYNIGGTQFKDNRWTFDNVGGAEFCFAWRQASHFVSFTRDTMNDIGSPSVRTPMLATSGTTVSPDDATFTDCVFRSTGQLARVVGVTSRWRFIGCQIAVNQRFGQYSNSMVLISATGLNGSEPSGSATAWDFIHCSIYLKRGGGNGNAQGNLPAGPSHPGNIWSNEADIGSWNVRDCVIARDQSEDPSSSCASRQVTRRSGSGWTRNVYYLYNKHSATNDSSQATGTSTVCEASSVTSGRWGGTAAKMYADTTWDPANAKPDLTPSNTGTIVHSVWPDGYVGAINTGGSPPPADVTAPDTIGVYAFALTPTSTRIRWIDAGDDANTGTATTYDIRWSTSQITTANFTSANVLATGLTPQVAGTERTYDHTGRTPSTTHWYAVSVYDEAGNWSGFETVSGDSATTPAAPRSPATYYVTIDGADGNSGASFKDGEAKSLNWALTQAIPGDVFIFGRGPEAHANFGSSYLRPIVSGDSLNRIVYRGATAASRDTVLFAGLSLDGTGNLGLDYTTFRWLTSQTEWDFVGSAGVGTTSYYCWRDSIVACRNRGYTWLAGQVRTVIADCDSIGDLTGLATGSNTPDFFLFMSPVNNASHNANQDVKIVNCNYYGDARSTQTQDRRFLQWNDALRCTMQNVVGKVRAHSTLDMGSTDVASHGMFWIGVQSCVIIDCDFTFEQNSTNNDGNPSVSDDWFYAFLMRGGCSDNRFIRTVWRSHKSSAVNNVVASFGQTDLIENSNHFDGCKFEIDGGITFGYKDTGTPSGGVDSLFFHNTVFASRGLQQNGGSVHDGSDSPFRFDGDGSCLRTTYTRFRNCTFYAPVARTALHPRVTTSLTSHPGSAPDSLWIDWPTTTFKQCIFVNKPSGSGADENAIVDYWHTNPAAADSNLYYHLDASPDSTLAVSRAGATQAMALSGICTTEGHNCNSRWGTPAFTDTAWATLDLTPLAAGAADFGPDGYVGAIPLAASGGSCVADDFERASLGNVPWVKRVGSTLTISGSSDLAPGAGGGDQIGVYARDANHPTFTDNQKATIGGVTFAGSYVGVMVRADTSGGSGPSAYIFGSDGGAAVLGVYDNGGFAEIATDGGAAPSNGDTLALEAKGDSLICTINGQSRIRVEYTSPTPRASGWPGVQLIGGSGGLVEYFWACDMDASADVIAPAAIFNLTASALSNTSVLLQFQAPGDDDAGGGFATSYDIRYRAGQLTFVEGDWAAATQVTGEPAPGAPGTTESIVISNLTPSTTYVWAIKASDEVPNVAAISNADSTRTLDTPDTTPPDSTSIQARLAFPNGVKLTWVAPGDDASTGTATTYDIRYSTDFITSGNFLDEPEATGEPTPSAAGASETLTFFGLLPNTTYYFAITTIDDVGNRSLISNTASITTADTCASTSPYGATQAWTWNFPRFGLYGGSSNVPYHRGYPLVVNTDPADPNPETVNLAMLDSLARFRVVSFNPNTWNFDSTVAAIRRLRQLRPDIKVLAEPRGSSAFHTDSIVCGGGAVEPNCTGADYKERNFEHLMWRAARVGGGGWTTGSGSPASLQAATPADSTGTRGFLWQKAAGYKGYFWGTRSAGYGAGNSANSTLLNVNLAWKDEFGRFCIVDSIRSIWKRQYVDPRDPVTGLPVFDGIMVDLATPDFSQIQTSTDSVDFVRAGYATSAAFQVAWEQAWAFLYQSFRDCAGDEFIVAGNAGSGKGFSHLNGWMRENWPGQQGGTWWSNRDWTPGGQMNDTHRYKYLPHLNWVFAASTTSDDSLFSPDVIRADTVAALRQEMRWTMGTAALGDGVAMIGPAFASLARSGIETGRSYAFWTSFDESAVDTSTRHSVNRSIAKQGWLGQPTGVPYQIISTTNTNTSATINPGLETDAANWTMTSFGDGSVARSNESAAAGGTWSIKVVNNTARPLQPFFQRIRSLGGLLAAPGTATYVLSFDVMSQDGPTFFRAQMRDSVSGSTFGASSESNRSIWTSAAAGVWQHIEYPIFVTSSTGSLGLQMEFGDTTHTALYVDNISVRRATSAGHNPVYVREFQYGMVVVNPTVSSIDVPLGRTMGRIQGYNDPIANPGGTASTITVPGQDARFLISEVTSEDDVTPPATVADLNAAGTSTSSFLIKWTAPGDDGTTGTATAYRLRKRGNAPIGDAITFAISDSIVPTYTSPANPRAPGTVDSVSVGGFPEDSTFYFAIRVDDEVPNISGISNSDSGRTFSIAPDSTSLIAIQTGSTSARLSWVDPGDDVNTGTATAYDLRVSLSEITSGNFDSAIPVVTGIVPSTPLGARTLDINGLAPNTTYWWALRTIDERPNRAIFANSDSTTTLPEAFGGTTSTSGEHRGSSGRRRVRFPR